MIRLKRSTIKYHLLLITLWIVCSGAIGATALILAGNSSLDRKTLAALLLIGAALLALYFSIALIKRVPPIKFDQSGIFWGQKFLNWGNIRTIRFNTDYFHLGYPVLAIEFVDQQSKKQVVYPDYYKNYLQLTRFILSNPKALEQAATGPHLLLHAISANDKKYTGYNILSGHFFTTVLTLFITITLISAGWGKNNVLVAVMIIPFLLILFFLWKFPNKVKIEEDALIIEKAFGTGCVRSYPLSSIYQVRDFFLKRPLLQVITNEFEVTNYDISTLPKKTIKALINDLNHLHADGLSF